MVIIDDTLVTDGVIQEAFACNLAACKGACCVEGDGGAPLEPEEVMLLEDILPTITPYLREEGLAVIQQTGVAVEAEGEAETPLVHGRECVYVTYENGITKCGIEKAYEAGVIDWQKPISCHLYPIRVQSGAPFETLHYHRWDICSAACTKGAQEQIKVYEFAKSALVRKYGEEWYSVLEQAIEREEQQ